ncbi:MAG: hypothetical protein IPN67_04120 [Bacteroidales bacterium]|nr:hypothetical protein [Bacteroidales bacterium]
MRLRTILLASGIVFMILSGIFLVSCGKKPMDGMIIITEADNRAVSPDFVSGKLWRYIPESHLYAIDPENTQKAPESLTGNFFSACSPDISFDGKCMLFAAQKSKDEPWQIWEMDLSSRKVAQITTGNENSIDPAYLPGGQLVFSRTIANDSLKSGHSLFTCNTDGSNLKRITFNPHSYFASSVLKDGRVITIGRQIFPEEKTAAMMVLRPDGTKAELFRQNIDGMEFFSRGRETADGKIIFIESGKNTGNGRRLASISYNRPLHSLTNLTAGITGDFSSVFPIDTGKYLVTYRLSESENYSLFNFDAESKKLGDQLFKSSDKSIIEAVIVREHQKPRKLPSEVDKGVKTGLLFCQNIAVTGLSSPENVDSLVADRIELIGVDSLLGVVKVERDGSFYLKVNADMPFKIRTLDADGNTLNGPGSWIWLRPNERRGCTGCHEDQEMVPANRVALATKNLPVAVPVHISGIKEKQVELE